MSGAVGSHQRSGDRDLDGIADDADPSGLADESVAHPVGRACKVHRSTPINAAGHLGTFGRRGRLCCLEASVHLVVIFDEMTSGIGGDDDPIVGDVKKPVA